MTIDELKYFLNIAEDDESYDEVITSLYSLAKQIFYQFTRRQLDIVTETDYYPNFEGSVIYLYKTPVQEIIEMTMKSSSTDPGEPITGYMLVADAIYFDEPFQTKILKVTYKAGYKTLPNEVDQILAQLVSFLWNYDATKVFLSGTTEAILAPNQMEIPKHIQDNMAIYRVGI